MAFGPKAIGSEEFGAGLSARARSTREAQLRAAAGVESQHIPESVRGARLEITKQFEAFRALGGQTGTADVSGAGTNIAFAQPSLPFQSFRDPVNPDDYPIANLGLRKKDIPFEDIRPATNAERGSVALVSTLGDHKVTQL